VIFTTRRVSTDTLCAALCVFLLLGVVWALAYSLCAAVQTSSFAFTLAPEVPTPSMQLGRGGSVAAVYFSFTTLTTLGYGDIIPTSPFTRVLACTEAIAGQAYLTVLVARLVSLHLTHSRRRRRRPDRRRDHREAETH
jgi:hypothetical protein